MTNSRILPPTALLISIIGMLALHFLLPVSHLVPAPWTLLGVFPLLLGVTISTAAEQQFRAAGTTVQPFATSSALVTGGFYRLSRNPMYLGFALVLGGLALILGSLSPWVIALCFPAYIQRRFIAREEQMMEDQFGHQWAEYATRARRWV